MIKYTHQNRVDTKDISLQQNNPNHNTISRLGQSPNDEVSKITQQAK